MSETRAGLRGEASRPHRAEAEGQSLRSNPKPRSGTQGVKANRPTVPRDGGPMAPKGWPSVLTRLRPSVMPKTAPDGGGAPGESMLSVG